MTCVSIAGRAHHPKNNACEVCVDQAETFVIQLNVESLSYSITMIKIIWSVLALHVESQLYDMWSVRVRGSCRDWLVSRHFVYYNNGVPMFSFAFRPTHHPLRCVPPTYYKQSELDWWNCTTASNPWRHFACAPPTNCTWKWHKVRMLISSNWGNSKTLCTVLAHVRCCVLTSNCQFESTSFHTQRSCKCLVKWYARSSNTASCPTPDDIALLLQTTLTIVNVSCKNARFVWWLEWVFLAVDGWQLNKTTTLYFPKFVFKYALRCTSLKLTAIVSFFAQTPFPNSNNVTYMSLVLVLSMPRGSECRAVHTEVLIVNRHELYAAPEKKHVGGISLRDSARRRVRRKTFSPSSQ